MVWADERDGTSEVYFRRFNGQSWEADVRLTYAPGESRYPSSAVDGDGRLHVVWWDDRDGNKEIYYKLRDPGFITGIPGGGDSGTISLPISIVPNPVRGRAGIRFSPTAGSKASLSIYDATGRLVWNRTYETRTPGVYQVDWPGTDVSGHPVAPGVYFLRVAAGRQSAFAKVIVLK